MAISECSGLICYSHENLNTKRALMSNIRTISFVAIICRHILRLQTGVFCFSHFEHHKALKYDIYGNSIKVARCDATYNYTHDMHAASHRAYSCPLIPMADESFAQSKFKAAGRINLAGRFATIPYSRCAQILSKEMQALSPTWNTFLLMGQLSVIFTSVSPTRTW